jgi:hypothetical protein
MQASSSSLCDEYPSHLELFIIRMRCTFLRVTTRLGKEEEEEKKKLNGFARHKPSNRTGDTKERNERDFLVFGRAKSGASWENLRVLARAFPKKSERYLLAYFYEYVSGEYGKYLTAKESFMRPTSSHSFIHELLTPYTRYSCVAMNVTTEINLRVKGRHWCH